jgi:hypothetical protein
MPPAFPHPTEPLPRKRAFCASNRSLTCPVQKHCHRGSRICPNRRSCQPSDSSQVWPDEGEIVGPTAPTTAVIAISHHLKRSFSLVLLHISWVLGWLRLVRDSRIRLSPAMPWRRCPISESSFAARSASVRFTSAGCSRAMASTTWQDHSFRSARSSNARTARWKI